MCPVASDVAGVVGEAGVGEDVATFCCCLEDGVGPGLIVVLIVDDPGSRLPGLTMS